MALEMRALLFQISPVLGKSQTPWKTLKGELWCQEERRTGSLIKMGFLLIFLIHTYTHTHTHTPSFSLYAFFDSLHISAPINASLFSAHCSVTDFTFSQYGIKAGQSHFIWKKEPAFSRILVLWHYSLEIMVRIKCFSVSPFISSLLPSTAGIPSPLSSSAFCE